MKYSVAVPFYAIVMVDVEADSPEQAQDRAGLKAQAQPCSCQTNVQIGDVDHSKVGNWEVFPEEEEGAEHGWTLRKCQTRKAVREFLKEFDVKDN